MYVLISSTFLLLMFILPRLGTLTLRRTVSLPPSPSRFKKNHAPPSTADTSRILNLAKAAADTLDKARPLREVLGSSLPEVKGPRIVSVGLGRDIRDMYEVRFVVDVFIYSGIGY